MTKDRAFLALFALPALLFIGVWGEEPDKPEGVVLSARLMEGKHSEVPGSAWYFAELSNGGRTVLKLQAIQMPGGYAGVQDSSSRADFSAGNRM